VAGPGAGEDGTVSDAGPELEVGLHEDVEEPGQHDPSRRQPGRGFARRQVDSRVEPGRPIAGKEEEVASGEQAGWCFLQHAAEGSAELVVVDVRVPAGRKAARQPEPGHDRGTMQRRAHAAQAGRGTRHARAAQSSETGVREPVLTAILQRHLWTPRQCVTG
jgi:hypothetical protein